MWRLKTFLTCISITFLYSIKSWETGTHYHILFYENTENVMTSCLNHYSFPTVDGGGYWQVHVCECLFCCLDMSVWFHLTFELLKQELFLLERTNHRFHVSGTLTVEQIYQDRDRFATLVREVAAPDVGRMGIEILSFTIKVWEMGTLTFDNFHFLLLFILIFLISLPFWQDVYDKVEYLSSLGKTQTAAVQRDADIGVAEAERDAGIRVRGEMKTTNVK